MPKSQRKKESDDTCHGCHGRGIVMGERTRITPKQYDLNPPFVGKRVVAVQWGGSCHPYEIRPVR